MKMNSTAIVAVIIVVMVGGVIGANALGLFGGKKHVNSPIITTTGDPTSTVINFNTPYSPAEIAGTNSFTEISQMFNVPLNDLGQGFGITSEPSWQDLKARDLKTVYANLPANVKLETESVRVFISFYTGKAYTYATSSYLPKPAVDILKQRAKLTADQISFLDSHTYILSKTTAVATSALASSIKVHTVTGETTFQTLISWGIPYTEIEKVIGDKLPESTNVLLRDYATQRGKDFVTMKSALQELADKY